MSNLSRRIFLAGSSAFAATTATTLAESARHTPARQQVSLARAREEFSLCTTWQFRTDADQVGEKNQGQKGTSEGSEWRTVKIPHNNCLICVSVSRL
jgi:hypothetical protein